MFLLQNEHFEGNNNDFRYPSQVQPRCKRRHLSFLDLFGFENCDNNQFHQFIVNYTNEKLFQFVFERNIRNEQDEYVREGIEWTPVDYVGNAIIHEANDKVYEPIFRWNKTDRGN